MARKIKYRRQIELSSKLEEIYFWNSPTVENVIKHLNKIILDLQNGIYEMEVIDNIERVYDLRFDC